MFPACCCARSPTTITAARPILVGDDGAQIAVGVDPRFEIDVYLDPARYNAARIEHILETHSHAEHLSGSATGGLHAPTGELQILDVSGRSGWDEGRGPGSRHEPYHDIDEIPRDVGTWQRGGHPIERDVDH